LDQVAPAFICYELVRLKPSGESFNTLNQLLTMLESLASKAKREGFAQLAERMEETRRKIEEIAGRVNSLLEEASKAVEDLIWSELCGLKKENICKEIVRGRRAMIECYKRNIVACRDATDDFISLEPGVKAIEAIYYSPSGSIERGVFLYWPGKERGPTRIDALAVYEKCLGVHVE
jgi:uncharacterized phage infection (PIP) family protein YhgE